jgi:hypothetical protein
MERAVLASKALGDDLCIGVDEDGHERLSAVGGFNSIEKIFSARTQKCLREVNIWL